MGGNSPQQVINTLCERIARGENELCLAVGAEFLGSLMKRLKGGGDFAGWEDPFAIQAEPKRMGDPRPGTTPQENLHGLNRPINVYPMFENALRARDGRSIDDHQKRLGKLFAPFSQVAATNPYAWFPTERSESELVTVTDQNRMISFPYPKYLNAIMEVDQSAGVIIASVRKARELGVPEGKWVYLHGCADASDLWYPSDRQDFHSSPAMRLTGKRALEMARIGLDDLDYIDLYSCFPIAVEVGAEELGLSLDDPRGLTVTGGLPYMGGPGNNYAMHSIATMMGKLRDHPPQLGPVHGQWLVPDQAVDRRLFHPAAGGAVGARGPGGDPARYRRPAASRPGRAPGRAGDHRGLYRGPHPRRLSHGHRLRPRRARPPLHRRDPRRRGDPARPGKPRGRWPRRDRRPASGRQAEPVRSNVKGGQVKVSQGAF